MFKLYSSGPSPSGWRTDACYGCAVGETPPLLDALGAGCGSCVLIVFFPSFSLFLVEQTDSAAAAAAVRNEAAPVRPTHHVLPYLHNKSLILHNQGERGYSSITSATLCTRMCLFNDLHRMFGLFWKTEGHLLFGLLF